MKDRVGKIVYNKKLQEGIYKMELKFDDFEKLSADNSFTFF